MTVESLLVIIAAGVWVLVIRSWWTERYLASIEQRIQEVTAAVEERVSE